MKPRIEAPWRLFLELAAGPRAEDPPLYHEEVTRDLGPLIEETHTRGVLAGALPPKLSGPVEGSVEVVWLQEPFVRQLEVELRTQAEGRPYTYRAAFPEGRWTRRAQVAAATLYAENTLAKDELPYTRLVAERQPASVDLPLAPLEEPILITRPLEELGVVELGEGSFVPERPILINEALEVELIELCVSAGLQEDGGAVLGQLVQLPEPLRGTVSPIVTVLTALIRDERHTGSAGSFAFDPEALAHATEIADLREMGERVITVAHTHGWDESCATCQRTDCALPDSGLVSTADYEVLETLFPSKGTLMPIAGRKRGVPGPRPQLELHGWLGGAVKPLRWRRYSEIVTHCHSAG